MSEEAAAAISAAFSVVDFERDGFDPYIDARLEMAQVLYKHSLRRLKSAFPGELCGLPEHSAVEMVRWMVRLRAARVCVPAAERAAERVGFNLLGAAVDFERHRRRHCEGDGQCE